MPHPTLSEIRPDDVRVTLTRAGWELIYEQRAEDYRRERNNETYARMVAAKRRVLAAKGGES
tara:strand:- start:338 stop:523 length:186 start_codon:yes stop_codon:yes gene_type:complete